MTITLKVSKTSPSHFLYKLTDGTDTHYIKFAHKDEHIIRLTKLLNIDVSILKENQTYELPSTTESEIGFENLLAHIVEDIDKKPIKLSQKTSRSIEGKAVSYSYRELKDYKDYWQGHTPFALFNALAEDIIEIPYADDPSDSEYRFEKTAFHTNHGTNHAVRQYILSKNYLDFLSREGRPEIKETANQLTLEEKSCLELALFLFRSGRTNERGWDDDASYGLRSAEIFRQIADELGYDKTLIDVIAQSYDYHGPLKVSSELPKQTLEMTTQKAQLFRTLLELSHESDLVRCEMNTDKTQQALEKILTTILPESYNIKDAAISFLDFSAQLCRETGSKIDSKKLQTQGSDMRGNALVTVNTTHDVVKTCMKLNALRPNIFLASTSPSQMWLQSGEHTYEETSKMRVWGRDIEGNKVVSTLAWTDEQIDAIPTEACIQSESKHAEQYVTAYHATTKSSRALELLCKALAPSDNSITWHRISPKRTQGTTHTDIELMKSKSLSEVDNSSFMQWHLLSCNPTLWQNADFDSQESTVDYFLKNSSVTNFNFSELINDLLDQRKLLVGQTDKRIELAKKFHALVNDPKFGEQGVIYQYHIPHHLVDEVAYISKTNGKLDTDNPSALDTLYALKTPGKTVPNQDTLQVRLLVPKLMEQDIASQLKVNTYSRMSPELELEFSQLITEIAQEALTGPSDVIAEEPKEKEKSSWKGFNALESFTRSKESFFYKPAETTNTTLNLNIGESDAFDVFSDDFFLPEDETPSSNLT